MRQLNQQRTMVHILSLTICILLVSPLQNGRDTLPASQVGCETEMIQCEKLQSYMNEVFLLTFAAFKLSSFPLFKNLYLPNGTEEVMVGLGEPSELVQLTQLV